MAIANNTNVIYQGAPKEIYITSSSLLSGAAPNLSASDCRVFQAVNEVSVVQTPSSVNEGAGQVKQRNLDNQISVTLWQAGQDTINLFQSTFLDKKVYIAVLDSQDKFAYTAEPVYLSPTYEFTFGREGQAMLTLTGQDNSKTAKAFWVTDDARSIPRPSGVTNLHQLSEWNTGPICEASFSQSSGSNWTGSGDVLPAETRIVWTSQGVEVGCGQILPRNGVGEVFLGLIQTGTGSIDEIEAVYHENKAFFNLKFENSGSITESISSAVSGGMTLEQTTTRNYVQDGNVVQMRVLHGRVITEKILDFINVPT